MSFIAVGVIGAGIVMNAVGTAKADKAQAEAEKANAAYYREQAKFARDQGDRKRMIFDRESVLLNGEQMSAFAKAGVDTNSSSLFMAQQLLYRGQESYAIQKEADMNVRLAMLRAGQAMDTAAGIKEATPWKIGANAAGTVGSSLI